MLIGAVLFGSADAALTTETGVDVHAARSLGPVRRELLGLGQEATAPDAIAALAKLGPPRIRVDAYLELVSRGPDRLDWSAFDERLSRIRAVGAQPLLILSYTPPWLAACDPPHPLEARHCPPKDLAQWRALVAAAAERAATRFGARDFEAWNEPDNPAFWLGTLADYLALYEASVAGVRDAALATGLPLRVGGPALLYPDLPWLDAFLAHALAKALPVDFVSFHHYADYPLHGPIGPLPGTVVTDNPLFLARMYGDYARLVRAHVDAALAAGLRGDAEVWIDEYNVNAGDAPRMRGAYGAAFLPAVVHAMADAPVDRASYFDTQHDVWGLFDDAGRARPAFHAYRLLHAVEGERLPAEPDGRAPQVGAYASLRPDGRVAVLLYGFSAQAGVPAHAILRIHDAPFQRGAYTVEGVDAERPAGGHVAAGKWDGAAIALDVPVPGVRLVTLQAGH